MEILADNSRSMAIEVGNTGPPEICQVKNGLPITTHSSSCVDYIVHPSCFYLEDVSANFDTKKRALDEESKDIYIPSKNCAMGSSSDALITEIDPAPNNSEAMLIVATEEETGERSSGSQSIFGSFEQVPDSVIACATIFWPGELSNLVSTEALNICETVQVTPNLQNADIMLPAVDCSIDKVNSKGELTTFKSAQFEMKDIGENTESSVSLGLVTVGDVEIEDTTLLQNISKIGHVDFEVDEVNLNLVREETTDVVIGMENALPDSGIAGNVSCLIPSEVDLAKFDGELHIADIFLISSDNVSASESQKTLSSLGSQCTQACQAMQESAIANDALQCVTIVEGIDGENGISNWGELEVEKADAVKALELKLVQVVVRSPVLEVVESGIDETPDTSSGCSLGVGEQEDESRVNAIMNGLSEDNKFTELLQPVVQLPQNLGGANGFFGGTFDVEHLSTGEVSDDLQQRNHAVTQALQCSRLEDRRSLPVTSNSGLDYPQQVGSDRGDGSMDRQDSGIATLTAATSAESQSSTLKLRMNLKAPGEILLNVSPGLVVGRSIPMKEILLKEAPASAKLLLASGLLDGHHVRYMGRGGHIMLTGVIQEGGVRCDCTACKGVQVVNVSAFEKHAGSSARHPSDFIFLENGKCIKDILEIGWNANKEKRNVMDVLKLAVGKIGGEMVRIRRQEHPPIQNQPVEKKARLLDSKPRLPLDVKPRVLLDSKPRMLPDAKPRPTCELKARGNDGRSILPRDRNIGEKEKETVSSPVLSRETSGPNVHKALFLPGGLDDNTEVGYYVKGQKFLTGMKKGAGICCSCCEQVISCSLFEQHAGWGCRRNPYTSIYLADGRSLHDVAQSLVVEQIVKQEGLAPSKIEHLDQCVECGDSGDLQLCTGCPNVFHQDCLSSEDPPSGDIFCPDCQEQPFGGAKDRRRSIAKWRLKGAAKTLLTKDHITGRCTRLLQIIPEAASIGGCVFCKSGDFAKLGFGPMTTMLCDQCEREYHVGCLKKHGLEDLKELPEGEWFCGQDCKHIHSILALLVANGPEPLADSIISKVLKTRQQLDKSGEIGESGNGGFEWQLLHGRGGDPATGKTLAEAVRIFSECFDPIADGVSGGDLIPLMVYRRSIRDQDFGGIYCVVLKQFGKVISAALIRVFGRQLAELPLLATIPTHQGQGYCKALLLSIERLLGVLRVERLALPAAEGAEGIWLNKFGFRRMSEEQGKDFHMGLNMMIFTGSCILEKEIAPLEITGSA